MVMLPAVDCALRDPRLRGNAIAAYMLILPELDLPNHRDGSGGWLPVKVKRVTDGLGISRRGAIYALNLLVEAGYLEQEGTDDSGVKLYRLVYACPVGSRTAPPKSA